MELYLGLVRAKPLPEEFVKKQAGKRIVRLLPARLVNHKFSKWRKFGWRNDDQAAFGIAFKRPTPLGKGEFKVSALGINRHDSIVLENGGSSLYVEPEKKKTITAKEIVGNGPGYHLYYLGRTILWPDCRLYLLRFVPGLYAPAGVAYDPKRPMAEFDFYVSLRYDPADDALYCDQVVAVELPTDRKGMPNFSR